MESRYQIVRQLADGKFHSGEELAQQCGISRAGVWKHIRQLRSIPIKIHAVRGRGYRMEQPLELLDREKILTSISTTGRSYISQLELHQQIGSTNGHLLAQPPGELVSGHICLAEEQTDGRGRRGRSWVSPFGSSIYLSIFWSYPYGPAHLSSLSLAAGVAVVEGLKALGITQVGLKWPNDILWDGRKLAGLLLEVAGEADGPSRVVLGLGINYGLAPAQGEKIDQPWADLTEIPGGSGISRNQLAAILLDRLLQTMGGFTRDGISSLVADWQRYDLYYGKPVSLQMGERQIDGIHRGIDMTGSILLEQSTGEICAYHGGEVSLRAKSGS
jgi:BirA family biotin operon repressor/biotin-[acetyl-CoA-carboxylase] ligase